MRISGSNAGYTMFRGSVKGTVAVRHHISTELLTNYEILTPLIPDRDSDSAKCRVMSSQQF